MATTTVGDKIIERLQEWGVSKLFGYPGDGINGILAALEAAGNEPRFIQSRHEEMSAFEATGYAKFSDEVGVCLATSGPGAVHLLNGLYDAKLDHVGVVAIVGQQARSSLGGHYQQEIDLVSLYKDVAHEYVHQASVPEQFPMLIDRAMRIAQSESTPTCVIVPNDLQEVEWVAPAHEFKMVPSSVGGEPAQVVADDDVLDRAAAILNEGERVAMLVGQGARSARDEVLQTVDVLAAGVAKALLGKDVLPDDHPHVTGSIGLLGTRPSYDLMMGCDTLLVIGSSFPYSQFLPPYGQARAVQIDIDPKMIGMRYPMDVNVIGDAQDTLRRLLPRLERKPDRSWQEGIAAGVEEWWQIVEARALTEADPVNPQRVFWELSHQLPHDAIITADSGSSANWYARDLCFTGNQRGSLSGTLATMGPGVPYAIGAKFAHPDRPVIALVGDGAMQMNGMAELLTIRRYWEDWDDPHLVVCVLNNEDLNQVTWEMRAMTDIPKFEASQTLPPFDYSRFAELAGLIGLRVEKPDDIAGAWRRALDADRPVVLDVVVDAEVPPLPPHVEWEQASSLMAALLKGDPEAKDIVKQGFKGKVQEFLPHGR